MANEIKLGYVTGETLTYAVYNPDGTQVTAPGTSLPEIGSTGYYTASNASIAAGDVIIVSDAVSVLFQGIYKEDVVSSALSAEIAALDAKIDIIDGVVDSIAADVITIDGKIDTIDTNVDLLIVEQQRVENVYVTPEVITQPRIINL